MAITAKQVKELRDKTGAGMMDCKKALTESEGEVTKAIEWLRVKGLSSKDKKSGRVAAEGQVASYVHMGGKIGVLVEINCETDFVARSDAFAEFVKDIAMHIAAASPLHVKRDEVPEDAIASERGLFAAEVKEQGKPEHIVDKIVTGKIDKWLGEICLLEQAWVKDPDKSIEQLTAEVTQQTGEKVDIRRFVRFQLGEGIEKKKENLREEIAKMQAAVSN